jgi:hypothetical protein
MNTPPAKLPDACPHCGAAAKGHALEWHKIYTCGLFIGWDKETHPALVVEYKPCARTPKPQPSETNGFPDHCPDCGADSLLGPADRYVAYKCGNGVSRIIPGYEPPAFRECTPKSPNPKPEQNTMAIPTTTLCGPVTIQSLQQTQPLPAPGTKWAYGVGDKIYVGIIKSAGPSGIYLDCKKTHGIYTLAEWNCLTRTQLPSKHDALRIPRRGPSRIKWFTVGAAACFFGRPFLPDLWSAVAGYVSRLM